MFGSARRALEEFLCAPETAARELDLATLRSYPQRNFVAGWRLSVAFADHPDQDLDVLIGHTFPFVAPRIALVDRSRFLVWPHVEPDGVLCLLDDQDSIDHCKPVAVVKHLLAEAARLIEDSVAGRNRDDMLAECYSYWSHAGSDNASGIRSLVRLAPPSRLIRWWSRAGLSVAADSHGELVRWIESYHGFTKVDDREFSDGLLLWLLSPLLPSDFPQTGADVRKLARDQSGEALDLLDRLVNSNARRLQILMAAPIHHGSFVGGVIIHAPAKSKGYGRARGREPAGFRAGHVPRSLQLSQFFGQRRIQRVRVTRSETQWVHGREHDAHLARLRPSSVAVIGCGSVGASVAVVLAQAGMGTLLLVDPQILTSPNTARHPLGAHDVGRRKCVALARKLRADFPHIQSVRGIPQGWEQLGDCDRAEVARCDLIVCAIGNIGVELAINHWARQRRTEGAVLYGWLEPFACAAHAVAIVGGGGCFECGFDARNQPLLTATAWPNGTTTRREPGCAATYQPYGAIELMAGVTTVAELALDCLVGKVPDSLHRIHVSSARRLQECGGTWSPTWSTVTNRSDGGFTFERRWNVQESCARCQPRPSH